MSYASSTIAPIFTVGHSNLEIADFLAVLTGVSSPEEMQKRVAAAVAQHKEGDI